MKSLVIGMGQIGTAVKAVTESEYSFDSAIDTGAPETDVDVMHICIPYSADFVAAVKGYMELVKPKHVAIWSTVPVGTCQKLPGAIHTPTEGKHPDLELSMRQMTRWIGYDDLDESKFFARYFSNLGLRIKLVESTSFTEALKLLSTTEYGVNIEFARYKKKVADEIDMPYALTKEWNRDYNHLYKELGLGDRFQKFVLDPPSGAKGGHCVTPNAKLLHEQYPDKLTKVVAEL